MKQKLLLWLVKKLVEYVVGYSLHKNPGKRKVKVKEDGADEREKVNR